MPLDASKSSLPPIPSQAVSTRSAFLPDAVPKEVAHMAVSYVQSEAEQQAVLQTLDNVNALKQRLLALDRVLSGDLSTYTRTEVEQMNEEAFLIEQKLASLVNPEEMRSDGPGF